MTIAAPLIFVRHGATPWNEESRYQGKTETSLSETGRQQSFANAERLARLFEEIELEPRSISIVHSPLQRASQTAGIIAATLNIPDESILSHAAMREISMGRWEGLKNLEVKDKFYLERKSRKIDRWNFKPLGGESLDDRATDVFDCLKSFEPNTIIVTHAGIIRIIQHVLGGLDKQTAASFTMPHEGLLLWKSDKTHFIV